MEALGHLQIEVMHFLWTNGPATVKQVMTALNHERPKTLAYTTFLTVMRNLARRKIVTQDKVGGWRGHRFAPLISREVYQAQAAKYLVDTLFQGNRSALLKVLAA